MSTPSTHKLYWADAYRRRFTAQVLERIEGDRQGIVLNRTLFYPAGGGQPHDTGRLGRAYVSEVEQNNGRIIHWLNRKPDLGAELDGEIHWPRRWDHMQQHSGQHLLSAAFLDLFNLPTIGFHLSPDSVTIDLPGPALSAAEIDETLIFTQRIIAEDRPITSYTITPEQISTFPLRKAPTVQGPVRVLEIKDIDYSACGGTHVRSTAAIGSIAITRLERRGDQTRVHFLCGGRAQADHLRRLAVTQALSERLTTGLDDLPAAIFRLSDDLKSSQKALRAASAELSRIEAADLWANAPVRGNIHFVRHTLVNDDYQSLKRMLNHLLERPATVAVLGWLGERPRWMAGYSPDLSINLRHTLLALDAVSGARGGGKPDLIQGGAANRPTLDLALDALSTTIAKQLQMHDE